MPYIIHMLHIYCTQLRTPNYCMISFCMFLCVMIFGKLRYFFLFYSAPFYYMLTYIYIWHYRSVKRETAEQTKSPWGPNGVTGTALSAPLRAGSANDGKKRDEKVRWHHGILAQGPSDVTWNLYFGGVLSLGWLAKWYLNWLDFCWPRKSPMLWSFGAPTSIALTSHDACNLPSLAMKNIYSR